MYLILEPAMGLVVLIGVLLIPVIGLNLLWNVPLVLLRALAPTVAFAQARSIKRLSATSYLLGGISLLVIGTTSIPYFGTHDASGKNVGVRANAHNVQMALERYAVEHGGQFPESLNELFPGYLAGYPRTPWNTQQSADIPAILGSEHELGYGRMLGPGRQVEPTTPLDFGAIGYACLGADRRHYVLTGTGRRGDDAVQVFLMTNL